MASDGLLIVHQANCGLLWKIPQRVCAKVGANHVQEMSTNGVAQTIKGRSALARWAEDEA